ncbi:restin-like protein [Senna tora]|uniref:Restin-like protein n=1 Tax=Senna tora TaxID=362788 RepID=A0A834U145_9FABA|nr:restin-like protein [Senna tora]
MSRITKWKIEKTKVKVVFRLQFHATHIPQSWDKLFISFIPSDSGKATAKTTKANVRNGACKWADPIYETTRLLQDIKTRQYDEKLYKLVVGMGSSRSSILGEANINLADFVDALKPTAIALPVNGCEAGTTLHVTVQLLTSKTGFREFEQQRELRERGLQTTSDQGTHDDPIDSKESSPDQNVNNHIIKASGRVKFKKESKDLPCVSSLEGEAGMNEEYADSAVGLDGSSTTSESIYAEKHDLSSTHEVESLKSTASADLGGLSLNQSPQPEKRDASDPSRGSDRVQGWRVDYTASSDVAAASEDTSKLKGNLEAIESSILGLKVEVCSLQNHADEIGVETLKFSEQLAAEISSGEELAKEVAALKSECSKFKDDFEQLKSSKLSFAYTMSEPTEADEHKLFQKSQLKWSKGLMLIEDKLREIQKKVSMGYHERNSRFLDADLEALVEVLHDLKQDYPEAISGINVAHGRESKELASHKGEQFLAGTGSESDLFQPEGMVEYISIPGLVSQESDSIDPTLEMKGKFFELLRELDESKTERDGLVRKMDQMECYYEALVQELEQNQRQMMGELQNLRNEHSACLYTISSSKTEIERMHLNMKEQIIKFDEDKRILNSLNNELERRAVSAEAALKRARLNYSIAVGQLQKDLELLSSQVLSMYETNENLIKQAFSDPSLPIHESCPETLNLKNLEEGLTSSQLLCRNENSSLNKQHLGQDFLLKDLKQSLHLQEGLYKQVEEEVCEMHFVNIYLEVFSKALQETLLEASVDIQLMKGNIDQLSQQLQLTTESKDLLMLRLQNAMDDIHSLNEYKASCTARSNDIAHQKEILEANFQSLAHENHLLTQKIIELEAHLTEYRSFENKYAACNAENIELKNLVKKESLANDHLREEISILQEELKAIRTEFDELASLKNNLQSVVGSTSFKLLELIASIKYSNLSLCSTPVCQDLDSKDLDGLLLQLEQLQQSACDRILQLIEEKKVLVNEEHMAQISLNAAKSDLVVLKQKFENELQEMVSNLSVSSALLQKLQLEFEVVVNTLRAGSDVEEIHSQHHKELLSDFDHLEAELQQLNTRNQDLAQEILRLDNLSGDLDVCKLSLAAITEEKEALEVSLQKKTEESAMISSEIIILNESLHSLHGELHAEKTLREKLEKTVTDLTSMLNEKQCQLMDFDLNKKELIQLKEMVAELESEKSRVSQLLLETDERLKDVSRESCSFNFLETQLSELHDFSIATDVIMIFTRAQFGGHIEELVEKLHSTYRQLEVLHKKNLDVESELNGFLSRESTYIEENTRLMITLNVLKSELESHTALSRALVDQNSAMSAELKEYKSRVENVNDLSCEQKTQCTLEVERLENLLASCREEIEGLIFSKEEVEIKCVVFQSKLDELKSAMMSLKQSDDELMRLQNQCNELTKRLSEQVLKTEEFKNLSIHLKELKDKADAECHNARDRRGHEGPPVAVQESLRIAFIKEQYETKLQELKQQLSLSKKHGEEMLWKLQDAIDDIEKRKKSEASHIKRNEELGIRILDLEAELQAVLSEKRNLLNAYDLVKAEKECSMISLECCKQEKQELEASLLKCNEDKSKIAIELTLTKELIENSGSHLNVLKEGNNGLQKVTSPSDEPIEEKLQTRNSISDIPTVGTEIIDKVPGDHSSMDYSFSNSLNPKEVKSTFAACSQELESSPTPINTQSEEALTYRGINGYQTVGTGENLQLSEQKHTGLSESLRSSLDHLNNELERMKNENLLPSVDDHNFEARFPGLQRELMQLHEANQELGNIFPVFNEISVSGNALERVLALEMELAEALQTKKKSSIQFQSSFLKQHSDEEAIFRSFRDINELIKDMLEIKARHVAVETELREMHDRYSQLSLDFAEVEGERQKLLMTLKNTRTPKRASFGDHSL